MRAFAGDSTITRFLPFGDITTASSRPDGCFCAVLRAPLFAVAAVLADFVERGEPAAGLDLRAGFFVDFEGVLEVDFGISYKKCKSFKQGLKALNVRNL